MKTKYYSVYDEGAQEYGPLFPAKNDHLACRFFFRMISDSDHKNEFKLYCMTEMDQESGQFDLYFNQYQVNVEEHKI